MRRTPARFLGGVRRMLPAALLLATSACAGGGASLSHSATLECVPYARQVSGIQLFGDAASWWDGARGQYDRSAQPAPGAVLVFRRSTRLPHGHVAVVIAQPSGREVTVTQANWVHGRIAHAEPVMDVSPANDWTAVRVWWEPSGVLGAATYPTYGFIRPTPPSATPGRPDIVAAN